MICISHAAVIHSPHSHIIHGEPGTRIGGRNRGSHAFTNGKRAPCIAASVHGLGKDGAGILDGLYNDIVGFSYGNTKLIHTDGGDVLAVSSHHGHLHARNAYIEVGHGRAIDKAEADFFAFTEQPRPVFTRALTVHEIGVSRTADVCKVSRVHLHFRPHLPVSQGISQPLIPGITEKVTSSRLGKVVVVGLLFQF